MSTYDIPGASVYGQAVALAKKRYQTRLADINKQRQSTLRQSGFLGDVDQETGLMTNLRTDPYNKYGGFQMLNRAQAARHDEMLGANLARGISSRGGLGAQALNDMRFDFGREDAEFGAGLNDALYALTRQQQEEKYTYDSALYEAQLAAAQSAIEAGDYGYGGGDYGYDYGSDPEPPAVAAPRPGIRPVTGAAKTTKKAGSTKKPAYPSRMQRSGNPMHRQPVQKRPAVRTSGNPMHRKKR